MYLQNKYSKYYFNIINRAKSRELAPNCNDEKAQKIKLANQGKRWVHNKITKERKYLDPSLVIGYTTIGWELGLGPKATN